MVCRHMPSGGYCVVRVEKATQKPHAQRSCDLGHCHGALSSSISPLRVMALRLLQLWAVMTPDAITALYAILLCLCSE